MDRAKACFGQAAAVALVILALSAICRKGHNLLVEACMWLSVATMQVLVPKIVASLLCMLFSLPKARAFDSKFNDSQTQA